MDDDGHAGLPAGKAHGAGRPVHVLAFQAGGVALTAAQMPAQFIEGVPFPVRFGGNDALVFLLRDGAFVFVAHGGPYQ